MAGTAGPPDPGPVVVAIGASAGGVEALQTFFSAIPGDTGAAFVVVLHLDPTMPSELPSLLGARTTMPVIQVEGDEKLEPNRVYVIPPNRRLTAVDHTLSAQPFDEPRGQRAPIDLLFRSLAERLGDGFAVILTGAGSDGAIGVRAAKEAGGIVLVQDPRESQFASMPRSAIATNVADFVLPLKALAAQLVELIGEKRSKAASVAELADDELFRRILMHVRTRTGRDFSHYKRPTVVRRIARRMHVTRLNSLTAYLDYLRETPAEANALLDDLLISVTTFFRDPHVFEVLAADVLPAIFHAKDADQPLRVWVPGCATGEEAYTLAILLLEEAARRDVRPVMQIFASDLDERALARAREGRFPAAIEADVSEERIARYFTRDSDGFRVRDELRDIVLFAAHDLVKDPPFSRLDLISCRNLLIYLDRELQEQVTATFHYALNPGGFLLVGSSEACENPPNLFRAFNRNARIYQSAAPLGGKPRLLPRLLMEVGQQPREAGAPVRHSYPSAALTDAAMHRQTLEKLAPPSILVDEFHRVVHLSESAGRYFQPSGGPLSGDVVDLVRPELRFELRSALHRAFENGSATVSLPIPVKFNGAPHRVHLHVKRIAAGAAAAGQVPHAIVMFIEGEAMDAAAVPSELQASNEAVHHLTQELELTQARLRTMREESEGANEELRAANEELQSINEEYRSTAEELETSKEELQSINEELHTVNSELKVKLETISRAHSDLQNLMAATDYGTLFLDTSLRIKRFTERVTEVFSLTPADEGRPITDFSHRLEYDDLLRDVRLVLSELDPIRREVRARHDRWYDVRMRPYRTVDDRIDGVVITLVDITDRRQAEEALRKSESRLAQQRQLVHLSHDPIFVWDFDGGMLEWNRGCEVLYGYTEKEALGQPKQRLLSTAVPGSSFEDLKAKLLQDHAWSGELHQKTKDGRALTVESRLHLQEFEGRRLVLESTHDITDRKDWDRRQQLLLSELTHRVKNTLAVVQAIAHQTVRTSHSIDDFVSRFNGRLAALAGAHNLLFQSNWEGADLAELAQIQLDPYIAGHTGRISVEGNPVRLPADIATPFGLVLHELATNAAKHGSLSKPQGTVSVGWTQEIRNKERWLKFQWSEQGGTVPAQSKKGFGTTLIDGGIPGAVVHREFQPTGFVCVIEVPLRELPTHVTPQ